MARKGLKNEPAEVKQAVRYLSSQKLPCNVVVKTPKHASSVSRLSRTILIPVKGKPCVYRAFKNYEVPE